MYDIRFNYDETYNVGFRKYIHMFRINQALYRRCLNTETFRRVSIRRVMKVRKSNLKDIVYL